MFLPAVFHGFFLQPPPDFAEGKIIRIKSGATLKDISEILRDERVIISPTWFRNFIIIKGGEKKAAAGDYYFASPQSLLEVASRIYSGDYGVEQVQITIPEGTNTFELAALLQKHLRDFDSVEFIKKAQPKEGYLFPDTYKLPVNASPDFVIGVLEGNFQKRVGPLLPDIENFGKTLQEVVTMASLLEKEARTEESRRTIAGILWKRLDIGMPLQIDAIFPYILNRNTYEVTLEDLKFDSPYNTYRYSGLPKGPITNPGLASIKASITPIESSFLYYLSDRAGRMYYASNFDQHKENRKYLDKN